MEFHSDKSDLVFGILSVPLRQRYRRENIRKNILVDAVSEGLRKQLYSLYLIWQCDV